MTFEELRDKALNSYYISAASDKNFAVGRLWFYKNGDICAENNLGESILIQANVKPDKMWKIIKVMEN